MNSVISTLRAIQITIQIQNPGHGFQIKNPGHGFQIKNSGHGTDGGIEVRIFGSHFLGTSISETQTQRSKGQTSSDMDFESERDRQPDMAAIFRQNYYVLALVLL